MKKVIEQESILAADESGEGCYWVKRDLAESLEKERDELKRSLESRETNLRKARELIEKLAWEVDTAGGIAAAEQYLKDTSE